MVRFKKYKFSYTTPYSIKDREYEVVQRKTIEREKMDLEHAKIEPDVRVVGGRIQLQLEIGSCLKTDKNDIVSFRSYSTLSNQAAEEDRKYYVKAAAPAL